MSNVCCSIDYGPGYGRLNGARRTQSAEIERGFGCQINRHCDDESRKDYILNVSCPRGYIKFHIGNLVDQFLQKAKRTGPSAKKSPYGKSGQGHQSHNRQGDQTQGSELSNCSQWARKYGRGTGMAIQDRKTDVMPLKKPYVEKSRERQLNL